MGYGIPSIPAKTKERILSGEYIDFAEFPPAKGRTCPLSFPSPEGNNIILVNAADLVQQKKLIPDIGTWVQCYTIYMGVICSSQPDRLPDLLGYLSQITRASQRYKWPSWVIFDQNFRLQLADTGVDKLAHLDPTLHAQCFTGQAKEGKAWCAHCHSLDHSSEACPLKPPPAKQPRHLTLDPLAAPVLPPSVNTKETCRNFNKPKGWNFGRGCYRIHRCSGCGGPYPVTRCPSAPTVTSPGPTQPKQHNTSGPTQPLS